MPKHANKPCKVDSAVLVALTLTWGRRALRGLASGFKGLRASPGAPFIVVFMILLLLAAAYLALGRESEADRLAVYAYYSLVIGVALELIKSLRDRG